jgi:hypothetical protein
MGNMGWIEIVLFYGIAIGFGLWQFWSTSRLLKRTRAQNAAKAAAEREGEGPPAA